MEYALKIKVRYPMLEALVALYEHCQARWKNDNEHDRLLEQHLIEMGDRLRKFRDKRQGETTISLTRAETLAFFQTWRDTHIENPLSGIAVNQIVTEIDQYLKHPAPYVKPIRRR